VSEELFIRRQLAQVDMDLKQRLEHRPSLIGEIRQLPPGPDYYVTECDEHVIRLSMVPRYAVPK
jgi:hypothetical protein